MSDVLSVLDSAAACVSALLMPEELSALIGFLRGEAWEEVEQPPTTTTTTTHEAPLRVPNVLIACYNYTPLAIAADVSLVSISSSGERSALVQNFERFDFRVFVVNLTPESRAAEDGWRPKSGSTSSSVVRLHCVEAAQAWCDAVYAEEEEDSQRSGPGAGVKRHRYEEGATTTATARGGASLPRTRRALFIIRCCANASNGRCGETERSRRSRDPLLLFLHDITAMAAVCRARQSTRQTRIFFSVLLLPDDLAYGGALLEETLRESMSRDYSVRLFRSSAACTVRRNDAERAAFTRRLEMWMSVPAPQSRGDGGGDNCGANGVDQPMSDKMDVEILETTRERESSFFFLRGDNLPFCCFLREAIRRFPVILHPAALRQLQALWASRRQLGDVVVGFHALLCPFAFSASLDNHGVSPLSPLRNAGIQGAASNTCTITTSANANDDQKHDGMCRYTDSVDILNALLFAAGQLADGQMPNEAVAFAVLYEDIVWKRPMRLQRIPGVVSVLQRLWRRRKWEAEMIFQEALATCVPVLAPSRMLLDQSYECQQDGGVEGTRAVVALPAAMATPAAKVPLASGLLRSALFAVLPPQESLEELRGAVRHFCAENSGGTHRHDQRGREDISHAAGLRRHLLSEKNFFSLSTPDCVRVLHVLSAHALRQSNVSQKFVPFGVLQRVCQISDEVLVRVLRELEIAGMVAVNGREFRARAALDV